MGTSTTTIEPTTIQLAAETTKQLSPVNAAQALVEAALKSSENGNPVSGDISPATPIRGLVLTKDNVVKIKRYVRYGLQLPRETGAIETYLKYDTTLFDAKAYPEISPAAFQTLYRKIHNHSARWSGLEARIKQTGTALCVFGDQFVITGKNILAAIDQMPVIQRVRKIESMGQAQKFSFETKDTQIKEALPVLLNLLKQRVHEKSEETIALRKDLEAFRDTMEQEIAPAAGTMNAVLSKLNLDEKCARLLQDRTQIEKELIVLDESYTKLVGYAFTGAAGLLAGPLGIISWAITGGIFGDKAEKVRAARNQKQAELTRITDSFKASDFLIKFVAETKDNMSELNIIINDAVVGLKNLEAMWAAISQYVEDADKELQQVNDSTLLTTFRGKLDAAVISWQEVSNMTKAMIDIFEAAEKEIR